jgi:hypothetical protein
MELVFSDDEHDQWSTTEVAVSGVKRLLCEVTAQDMEAMSAEEYSVFYGIYTQVSRFFFLSFFPYLQLTMFLAFGFKEAEQRLRKWKSASIVKTERHF